MSRPRPDITGDERPVLTSKGDRSRQRIVDAAAELIYRNGAAATTIQEVRNIAGVSSSQLYHYFADKQALVRAVAAYQGDRMVAGQEAAGIDSLQALRAWRDALLADSNRALVLGGCPLASLGAELADTDPGGRVIAAAKLDRWHAAMARGLELIRERGELPDGTDTDDLATALLAALQGGLLLSQITQSSDPLKQALDAMLALIETARNRH
jgi:AcrR family transcriptional regulator